jgi:hypothetical protein
MAAELRISRKLSLSLDLEVRQTAGQCRLTSFKKTVNHPAAAE